MNTPVPLGEGILEYRGSDNSILSALSQSHHRFLDYLWLPAAISEITPAQVSITNRFRENQIGQDSQFSKANRARKAARLAMDAGNAACVLEIGMGSFPIFIIGDQFEYHGLDIDPVAIAACHKQGLNASLANDKALRSLSHDFDFFVALYVFHFAYEVDFIQSLKQRLTPDSVGIFTVIVTDNLHFLKLLSLLGPEMPWIRILKLPLMASKEFWVVSGGIDAADRATAVANAITIAYET